MSKRLYSPEEYLLRRREKERIRQRKLRLDPEYSKKQSERKSKWNRENRERHQQSVLKWNRANKEKFNAIHRKYYAAHADRINEKRRRDYERNNPGSRIIRIARALEKGRIDHASAIKEIRRIVDSINGEIN